MNFNYWLSRYSRKIAEYLRPDPPRDIPSSMVAAIKLAENNLFAGFLSYRNYDDSKGIIHLDDGKMPAVGLMFTYDTAGNLNYEQFEQDLRSLVEPLPIGSTFQTASYITTHPTLPALTPTGVELIDYINSSRQATFVHAVEKQRPIADKQGYLVSAKHYLSFRIPFEGDIREEAEIQEFLAAVQDFREAVEDSLSKHDITIRVLTSKEFKSLLQKLLNYSVPSDVRASETDAQAPFHSELIRQDVTYECKLEGGLQVTYQPDEKTAHVAHIAALTSDAFSADITMQLRSGVHLSKDKPAPAIMADYWVYTNYIKLSEEALNESLQQYLSIHQESNKNKNVDISSSIWHQQSLKHLLGDTAELTENEEANQPVVVAKAYTGVTLYSKDEKVLNDAKNQMLDMYNNQGYRTAEEVYISLMALICSLPFQLTLHYEHPQTGFRRANIMEQKRGLALHHVPSVWYGAQPSNKGTLHITRQGLVGRFSMYDDGLQDTILMAKTDWERNAILKEVLVNALGTGCPLYVIDSTHSLGMMAEYLGWGYVSYNSATLPNPYVGIKSSEWLTRSFEHLVPLTIDLAFPNGLSSDLSDKLLDVLIKESINLAWKTAGQNMTLASVFNSLVEMTKRATDAEHRKALMATLEGLAVILEMPEAENFKSVVHAPPLTKQITIQSIKDLSRSPIQFVLAYLMVTHATLTRVAESTQEVGIVHNGLSAVYKNLIGHGLRISPELPHVKWILTVDSLVVAQQMTFIRDVLFRSRLFLSGELDLRTYVAQGVTPILSLTNEEFAMLNSLSNTRDHMEVFVKQNDKSNIFLWTPDLQSKLMFTSAPRDMALLEQMQAKTHNLYTSIDNIIKGS